MVLKYIAGDLKMGIAFELIDAIQIQQDILPHGASGQASMLLQVDTPVRTYRTMVAV